VARGIARGDRDPLADLWAAVARDGAPLIEPDPAGDPKRRLVTFVYRADSTTRNVLLFRGPNATMDLSANPLVRLPGTDLWYRSYTVPSTARFTYKLGRDIDLSGLDPKNSTEVTRRLTRFGLDPANPRRFPASGTAPPLYLDSVVELPDAPPNPWTTRDSSRAAGTVTRATVATKAESRSVSVYTPPRFDRSPGPYDLLIVFDGFWYLTMVPTPTMLDNLIAAGKIAPVVAVFVETPGAARDRDLHCSSAFTTMLADELVPWAREQYHTSDRPERTTVAGSSAGGLAATCAALDRPDRFGNVLSMSGAYWWHPKEPGMTSQWLPEQFAARSKTATRFYLAVGTMENAPQPEDSLTMLGLNRRLRNALRDRGYDVAYSEFDGGHEYVNWAASLADGLIALARYRTSSSIGGSIDSPGPRLQSP
jgi:enterochelin esterase family protein